MNRRHSNLRPLRQGQRRAGLSLIECLLASMVLAIAASAGLTAIASSYQQRAFADERLTATRLAADLMEQAVSRSYAAAAPPSVGKSVVGDLTKVVQQATDTLVLSDLLNQLPANVDSDGRPADPGPETYRQSVTVQPATAVGAGLPSEMGYVLVDVETPGGQHVRLQRLVLPD